MLDLGVVLAFRVLKLFVGLLNQQFKKLCFFLNVVWNVYISDSSGNALLFGDSADLMFLTFSFST